MPSCRSIEGWTLASLIGSYLDLTLAYILLIGSTVAYLTSKILSIFGLALPCPCGGLFGTPGCVQEFLLRAPAERIGSVARNARTRFPFDVVLGSDSPDILPAPLPLALPAPDTGSVAIGRRPVSRRTFRKRRGRPAGPARLSWQGDELGEGVLDNFVAVEDGFDPEKEKALDSEPHDITEGHIPVVEEIAHSCSVEEIFSGGRDFHISDGNESAIIHNLEHQLEEVQETYDVLCLELDKERSAAASAADEAMAMILRLQSEKASVGMELSQYQRIIEEKSAYDEEEMEILKEIIIKRERETHVLEKEVEAYRKMISGEMIGEKHDPSVESPDDPTELLKTICEEIRKKEKMSNKMKWADQEGILKLEFPDPGDACNLEFQEKGMLTMKVYPQCHSPSMKENSVGSDSNKSQGLLFCEDPSHSACGEDGGRKRKIPIGIPVQDLGEEDGKDATSQFETDSSVLDVHVIDDKNNAIDARIRKASNDSQTGCSSEILGTADLTNESSGASNFGFVSCAGVEGNVQWSRSDIFTAGHLSDSASDNDSLRLRRSSMSAVDSERFTLENEVEILCKRLKTIQHGRERLSFPMENREKETFQLELLEKIASQLQEIRKITEPGKGIRQASLPPLPSKGKSKKKRCRSISWGLRDSI